MAEPIAEAERLERWRLVLGSDADREIGCRLGADAWAMDGALEALYGGKEGKGGLGSSTPSVSRWLGTSASTSRSRSSR